VRGCNKLLFGAYVTLASCLYNQFRISSLHCDLTRCILKRRLNPVSTFSLVQLIDTVCRCAEFN
jgi:hypothetical protein